MRHKSELIKYCEPNLSYLNTNWQAFNQWFIFNKSRTGLGGTKYVSESQEKNSGHTENFIPNKYKNFQANSSASYQARFESRNRFEKLDEVSDLDEKKQVFQKEDTALAVTLANICLKNYIMFVSSFFFFFLMHFTAFLTAVKCGYCLEGNLWMRIFENCHWQNPR